MMLKSKGFEINHFTKDSNVKNRTFALSPSSVDWLRSLGLPSIFFESLSEIKSMKIFDSSIKNSGHPQCGTMHKNQYLPIW
jgi:hypothetical protein